MPNSIDTPVPFIDPNSDPAIFVKALASQTLPPPVSETKVRRFAGYARDTTYREWIDMLNKHIPHEVYFEETNIPAWTEEVPIPGFGLELAEMWKYVEEIGYFGGDQSGTTIMTEVRIMLKRHEACTDIEVVEIGKGANADERLDQESRLGNGSRPLEEGFLFFGPH